jgi:hypothetical protein
MNQTEDELMDHDHEALMDHVALEFMHAVDAKDKEGMLEAFEVLAADVCSRMSMPEERNE